MSQPIRIHPANPKCFEFRGRPLALITATEHYGAVMNRPFDFRRYLEDAAANDITLTRLFTLFRELQSGLNPYSTCKPESTDYVAPYERTGPGEARDGLPRYDLDLPNAEFFDRLHKFLALASEYGIIVEVVLFSNTYADGIWSLNPLNAANNVNDVEEIDWAEYNMRRHRKLFDYQCRHARRIVEETRRYDNVIYEICNEPGGGNSARPENPLPGEVDEWQRAIAEIIRDLAPGHLIAGQEAFTYDPWQQPSTKSFRDFPIDVVNMHPLPNTTYDGAAWDMGRFMSKQLRLRDVRDFALATYGEPKPLNYDEDHVASRFRDPDGWTIHRKRAWTTLLCGAHYDVIDFSIYPGCDAGTQESRAHIRSWMGYLSRFVHSLDLVRARPASEIVVGHPEHMLPSVLAVDGDEYAVYLADERELDEPGCGEEFRGELALNLPDGTFSASTFSPATGEESPGVAMNGGAGSKLALPLFRHDIALRVRRADA